MKINSRSDWKLGAAVGTALSLGSGAAVAGPHGFDLHNVFPVSYTHLTLPTILLV